MPRTTRSSGTSSLASIRPTTKAPCARSRRRSIASRRSSARTSSARILEKQGKYQQALEEYTRGIQAGPRFVEAYAELGRLYADLGYTREAALVLTEGIRVAIPNTEEEAHLHYLLGTIYQESMNYQGAIEEYRAALRIVPSMADVLFSLGWCYAEIDERDEAKRYLRRFIEAAGPETPAHIKQAAQNKISQLGG